jgi:hypothetical protein
MGHGHMEKHFYPEDSGSLADISLPPGWDPIKKNLRHTTLGIQLLQHAKQTAA